MDRIWPPGSSGRRLAGYCSGPTLTQQHRALYLRGALADVFFQAEAKKKTFYFFVLYFLFFGTEFYLLGTEL